MIRPDVKAKISSDTILKDGHFNACKQCGLFIVNTKTLIVLEGPWQVSTNSQNQRKQKVSNAYRLAVLVVAVESLYGIMRMPQITGN